jgi:hypothetical protein
MELLAHICHSDEMVDVLDLLSREFPNEFRYWLRKQP